MVALDVGDRPDVPRVLPKRVAGILPGFRSFEVFLAGVLLWDANRIDLEYVIITLSEPHDRFVATRQTPAAMQPMLEVPHDSVPHLQP